MFRLLRAFLPGVARQLSAPVLDELVALMFTAPLPVATIGVAVFGTGLLIASIEQSRAVLVMAVASAVITFWRLSIIRRYRRRPLGTAGCEPAATWERRYAAGSFCFALVLGLLDAQALMLGGLNVPMLVSALIFGYGSGLVTRISVRPAICGASLLLAAVPTVAGYGLAPTSGGLAARTAHVAEMVLITGFAVIGLETIAQSYQKTLSQLLIKQDLKAMVVRDALTSLPNRLLLRSRFEETAAENLRTGRMLAVHCLDLDRFKAVNDTFGHPTGDALLQAVGKRLVRALKAADTAARIGGDEFVILQCCVQKVEDAELLARRITGVISAPYDIEGRQITIGVSVGIALAPPGSADLEQLLSRADAALYLTKGEKRGGVSFWNDPPTVAAFTAA